MTSNQTDAAGAASDNTSSHSESTLQKPQQTVGSPAVRFASVNQEIEPEQPLEPLEDVPSIQEPSEHDIRELSATLHSTQLQNRRMSHFAFEPVSLPASRQPSNEDTSGEPSRHNTNNSSGRDSPRQSSSASTMHTPPLTPAATKSRDAEPLKLGQGAPLKPVEANEDASVVTPQISGGRSSPGTSRPPSSGQMSTRPTSLSEEARSGTSTGHHRGFSIGPTDQDSVPTSRESSPSRPSPYTRALHPAVDVNDPYAANRRAPQSRNLDSIDPRFVFNSRRHRVSPSSSSTNLPRSSRSTTDVKEKRSSFFGGGSKKESPLSHLHDESSSSLHKGHGSMAELRRFLKLGNKSKRGGSPAASIKSGTRTPTTSRSSQPLPFGEDHGLVAKYGKFGKILGAGAGGSVRVMKRSSDGTTFAVKEFRARHSYESEKEYNKKVTAEFCIGSALHHGNIIETLDIIQEKGKYYEVMEYAPYDLFAIVMTGKMSREEVTCSFLQILSGVTYLHRMGLAHRDLKLDNVVVNEQGIMKIIDFGSASVFRYPFETGINLASGIVGSDPYLAPEVYDERKYDPQPTDIWSLAIIFCCMSLRRFPWKMPRMTDNSYKLFASPPSPGTDIRRGDNPGGGMSRSENDIPNTAARDAEAASNPASRNPSHDNTAPNTTANAKSGPSTHAPSSSKDKDIASITTTSDAPAPKQPVIKGPWRLLRLLPRESRHIIGRMLEIDPKKRATLEEILADPWIAETNFCRQLDGGEVIKAEGHTHTLEPPAAPTNTK